MSRRTFSIFATSGKQYRTIESPPPQTAMPPQPGNQAISMDQVIANYRERLQNGDYSINTLYYLADYDQDLSQETRTEYYITGAKAGHAGAMNELINMQKAGNITEENLCNLWEIYQTQAPLVGNSFDNRGHVQADWSTLVNSKMLSQPSIIHSAT